MTSAWRVNERAASDCMSNSRTRHDGQRSGNAASFDVVAEAVAEGALAPSARASELFARLFLFKGYRDIGIGRQPHLVTLDIGDETAGNEVMMARMPLGTLDLGARVLLGQLDAVALNAVDGTDMNAVSADHFHMFANLGQVSHKLLLSVDAALQRIGAPA